MRDEDLPEDLPDDFPEDWEEVDPDKLRECEYWRLSLIHI